MRLLFPCPVCFHEFGIAAYESLVEAEYQNEKCYEVTCSQGHRTLTVLELERFEVLFEIGVHAILDGYYREAISSFSAGLERFYEFSLEVMLAKNKDAELLFTNCWKNVVNASERQLGAFIFLWGANFNEVPVVLSTDQVSHRNAVIHKGKIPTKEEAINYGKVVLDILLPKIEKLKEHFANEIAKVTNASSDRSRGKTTDKNPLHSSMSMSTLVSLRRTDLPHKRTIEERIAWLEKSRFRKSNSN